MRQRILIVDDEPVIAFTLEDSLIEAGFESAGVVTTLDEALSLIQSGSCDAAVLDANLAGVSSIPAAAALTALGLSFIVVSGYSLDQHQSDFPGACFLQKPCGNAEVIAALRGILPILD